MTSTNTIGQLNNKPTLEESDIFEIASNAESFHVTSQAIAIFVGSIPFQSLRFGKIAVPSDPPSEESILYVKEIDSTNNGLFIKIKKSGVISEV